MDIMKNVIAFVICLIITLGTLFISTTIRSKEDANSIYCGAPIPFLSLDLSNRSDQRFPQTVRCGFAIFGAAAVSVDWFGLLVSVALLLTMAQIFLFAKDKYDPHQSRYDSSPIKKNLEQLSGS
jgi:hypothetical protein